MLLLGAEQVVNVPFGDRVVKKQRPFLGLSSLPRSER
jgi:hypothetical protein